MSIISKLLEKKVNEVKMGLDVIFSTPKELDKFVEIINKEDWSGEVINNTTMFFEESEDTYDELEIVIRELLYKNNLDASIEGR